MQSTATARRLIATRLKSGALVHVAIAVAALGGSLAILGHGIGAPRPGSELDLLGGILAAGATPRWSAQA